MNSKVMLVTIFILFSGIAHAVDWALMSRHGECFNLAKFNQKLGLMNGASSPFEMEKILMEKGVKFSFKSFKEGNDDFYFFDVPSEALALIVVNKAVCKEFGNERQTQN